MTRDEIVTALRCHCDAIETGACPRISALRLKDRRVINALVWFAGKPLT